MRPTSTCLKCKRPIERGRRLCDLHRKHTSQERGARVARPDMGRVLGHPVANESFYADRQARLITTVDILALREQSTISWNGEDFELAAELAQGWTRFLNHQPITPLAPAPTVAMAEAGA